MPAYPGSEYEKRVSVDHLNAFVSTVFERCTMSTDDARGAGQR